MAARARRQTKIKPKFVRKGTLSPYTAFEYIAYIYMRGINPFKCLWEPNQLALDSAETPYVFVTKRQFVCKSKFDLNKAFMRSLKNEPFFPCSACNPKQR